MRKNVLQFAAVAVCLPLLACSSSQLQRCPSVSVLFDTATAATWQGSPPQFTYVARIVDATRDCDIKKFEKEVGASVDIKFQVVRPHAGAAATFTVPFFVAISTEGHILAKKVYGMPFTFDAQQTVIEVSQSIDTLSLTVGRDKQATDYGILVGFQLSKAQLDYNRRAGRYPR